MLPVWTRLGHHQAYEIYKDKCNDMQLDFIYSFYKLHGDPIGSKLVLVL
jgi:hypothetical protein